MCIIVTTTTTKWNYDEQMKQNEMFATPATRLAGYIFILFRSMFYFWEVNTETW